MTRRKLLSWFSFAPLVAFLPTRVVRPRRKPDRRRTFTIDIEYVTHHPDGRVTNRTVPTTITMS